ncbi:SGNH/GDSL hydrolase family protein [Acidiphilium iwatense]|uniref:SGNH/GDSL hydrolase family protein n=1 Tax=Acidiphilium iwatense TaxID=768198 RepID=A0ABS9DZQ8_9PROT|nr:SGNH/GDSL hydrolase family protein [Acidiphilium iwatense]MCF3948246.1 SGNH/GDSL hydrolase family protein [Acidiphilium iwatense]
MKAKISGLLGLVLVFAWVGWSYAASPNGVPTYLALGDSLAYGMQIGHLRQEMKSGTVDATSFDTGYVNRLATILGHSTPKLRVVDLGCPGETTSSFISGPCAFATNGKPFGDKPLPMHVKYQGAQLLAGLKYLENPNDNIRLITIDIGINDLRADELACGSAADFEKCLKSKWPTTAKTVARNLSTILHNLKYAAPHTKILVMTYYNWLGLQHPRSDAQVRDLNAIITRSAKSINATTIHTFPAFNESGKLCELSLICGPTKDLHPTNAGYRLIARLFYRGME